MTHWHGEAPFHPGAQHHPPALPHAEPGSHDDLFPAPAQGWPRQRGAPRSGALHWEDLQERSNTDSTLRAMLLACAGALLAVFGVAAASGGVLLAALAAALWVALCGGALLWVQDRVTLAARVARSPQRFVEHPDLQVAASARWLLGTEGPG